MAKKYTRPTKVVIPLDNGGTYSARVDPDPKYDSGLIAISRYGLKRRK